MKGILHNGRQIPFPFLSRRRRKQIEAVQQKISSREQVLQEHYDQCIDHTCSVCQSHLILQLAKHANGNGKETVNDSV